MINDYPPANEIIKKTLVNQGQCPYENSSYEIISLSTPRL